MNHSDFAHLHVHTQYSLLDGACLISNLIDLAHSYHMPALAMTDHGNMFGAIEFYRKCIQSGVKPIIGCEMYIAPGSRFEKSSHGIQEASFHLILLARDEAGYKNLMKLVSIGYLEGFYYRPRIDKEILAEHAQGLIGMSACLKGEIPHLALSGQKEKAVALADDFKQIFGPDNFYLELQDNLLAEQKRANKCIIALARQLSIGLVGTNDVHYLARENAKAHDALLCIQTQTTLDNPDRMRFQTKEFYFKSPREMKQIFAEVPEAITNTIAIAEKCNLELSFNQTHLPHYTPPQGKTKEEYLRGLCEQGIKRRYQNGQNGVMERLDRELDIIGKAGYTSYFLIAWDFVRYAKEQHIPVGPGRGSAAGSIVSYALGITNIDPLSHGLLFERFLNPDRVSPPDIDIDFCYERRGEVINYVTEKYGKHNVAQIITFGTMGAKAVVRDVGRVMNMPYAEVDRIAKLIPYDPNMTLKQAIELEPELKNAYENDPNYAELLNTAMSLEGLTRHASTHAAGVVISDRPLTDYVPLFKSSDSQITTGYPMDALEKIGLLKIDFLGLRTLTVISETIKIIKRTQAKEINIEDIPLDDKKTMQLLASGESAGIFQLESSGMRDLLRKLRPEKFEDMVALLALFRPGPIGSGMVTDFIKRKHGEVAIRYDHERLEPILKDTYGIILYQEQVMRIASELAGFSLAQADLLRRAMSKKISEVMEEQRKSFIDGCTKRGIASQVADKIFSLMEYFAGYGFNRSHSTAYALISYRTAYLKANFPLEFMTALLTSEEAATDKLVIYINDALRLGIKILPPDVNESFAHFSTIDEKSIRFGLGAVKGVGRGAIESIVRTRREQGEFISLYNFCERVDQRLVNRKVIENLIKCGAFDTLGLYRSQQMAIVDRALEAAGSVQKDRQRGQMSFFDSFENNEGFKKSFQEIPDINEWPENQLLSFEKELLGFYVTGHPLVRYERMLRSYASSPVSGLNRYYDGDAVSVGGIINKVRRTVTKSKNERMAIINLEDLSGTLEVLVFPKTFTEAERYIRISAVVLIKGRLDLRDEQPKIIAREVIPIEEVPQRSASRILLDLTDFGVENGLWEKLKQILSGHKGKVPVFLDFSGKNGEKVRVSVGPDFYAQPSEILAEEVENLLGAGRIKFSAKESA